MAGESTASTELVSRHIAAGDWLLETPRGAGGEVKVCEKTAFEGDAAVLLVGAEFQCLDLPTTTASSQSWRQ